MGTGQASMENVTQATFDEHLGTTFQCQCSGDQTVDLKLIEVQALPTEGRNPDWRDPFSLLFLGTSDALLQQGLYTVLHEQLNEVQLFLVPIAQDEQGIRYESIFN